MAQRSLTVTLIIGLWRAKMSRCMQILKGRVGVTPFALSYFLLKKNCEHRTLNIERPTSNKVLCHLKKDGKSLLRQTGYAGQESNCPLKFIRLWWILCFGWFKPNVAKILYRRVGCAHQISLISSVNGGHSPPYTNNTGLNHGWDPAMKFQIRFIPVFVKETEHFQHYLSNQWVKIDKA